MEKKQNNLIPIQTFLLYTWKTDDIYKEVVKDVEARFGTLNKVKNKIN